MPIHSPPLSQLPPPLRQAIDRDLQRGEKVMWLARPVPGQFVFKWVLMVILGLAAAAMGRFVLVGDTVRFYLMVIGLPVAGIGVIGALYAWRWVLNTAYIVTDRRAIIISGAFRGPAVRSFEPASLTSMNARGRSLVFTRECRGEDSYVDVGFLGIADVDGAERAIRDLIQSAASQTRQYINRKWGFELDHPALAQITTEDANSDDEWPLAVAFVCWDPSSRWGLNIWASSNRNAGALLPGSMPCGSPPELRLHNGPEGRPTTPEAFIEQYKAAAAKASRGYAFVSAETIELAGWPAAMLVYAFDDASQHIREASVQALGSPVAVQFTFSGDATHWHELEPIFRRILQSVKLGNPSQSVRAKLETDRKRDNDLVEASRRQKGRVSNAKIVVGGRALDIKVSGAILHLSGEFAGNLDFSVEFSEAVATKEILADLRVKMPGRKALIAVLGCRETPVGVEVTVDSKLVPPGQDIPRHQAPSSADVFWIGQSTKTPVARLSIATVS